MSLPLTVQFTAAPGTCYPAGSQAYVYLYSYATHGILGPVQTFGPFQLDGSTNTIPVVLAGTYLSGTISLQKPGVTPVNIPINEVNLGTLPPGTTAVQINLSCAGTKPVMSYGYGAVTTRGLKSAGNPYAVALNPNLYPVGQSPAALAGVGYGAAYNPYVADYGVGYGTAYNPYGAGYGSGAYGAAYSPYGVGAYGAAYNPYGVGYGVGYSPYGAASGFGVGYGSVSAVNPYTGTSVTYNPRALRATSSLGVIVSNDSAMPATIYVGTSAANAVSFGTALPAGAALKQGVNVTGMLLIWVNPTMPLGAPTYSYNTTSTPAVENIVVSVTRGVTPVPASAVPITYITNGIPPSLAYNITVYPNDDIKQAIRTSNASSTAPIYNAILVTTIPIAELTSVTVAITSPQMADISKVPVSSGTSIAITYQGDRFTVGVVNLPVIDLTGSSAMTTPAMAGGSRTCACA